MVRDSATDSADMSAERVRTENGTPTGATGAIVSAIVSWPTGLLANAQPFGKLLAEFAADHAGRSDHQNIHTLLDKLDYG